MKAMYELLGIVLGTILVQAAGCAADPGIAGESAPQGVSQKYERSFSWGSPAPCDVFLHRRIVDEEARVVEYDARIGGRELAAIYSIDPDASLPLAVAVVEARGAPILLAAADDHRLQVMAPDGAMALEVADYDDPSSGASPVSGPAATDAADPDALALLRCALPIRAELGYVPAFLLNRAVAGHVAGQPDIGQSSAETQPLLGSWDGQVTVLGAWVLQGMCLRIDGGAGGAGLEWGCGCFELDDPIAGTVIGTCGGSPLPYPNDGRW
jgi:hypothetical protein